jgi:hypothetical protein
MMKTTISILFLTGVLIFTIFGISAVQAGTDNVPPTRSSGSPAGSLAYGTAQTIISMSTDELATCRYSISMGTLYGTMESAFSSTGGTSHSTTVTNLSNGGTYNYYVRCQDSLGNANTDDYLITFSISNTVPDTSPPSVPENIIAGGISDSQINLSWKASYDSYGVAGYRIYRDGVQVGTASAAVYEDKELLANHTYYYNISAYDATGNQSSQSGTVTGTTKVALTSGTNATSSSDSLTPAANQTTAQVQIFNGMLFKHATSTTVYILENGSKRPLSNWNLYLSNYPSRPIAILPDSQNYPEGQAIRYGPGTLIKGNNNPAIFLILDNNSRYGFVSSEEFFRFGYRFDMVQTVTPEELTAYPLSAIAKLSYHATNNFIKYSDDPTVYRISTRKKQTIPSMAVLTSYIDPRLIITVPKEFQYETGSSLSFPDGMILKGSGSTVYLIENGTRRKFESSAAFTAHGYNFSQVKTVQDADINLHQEGSSIQ